MRDVDRRDLSQRLRIAWTDDRARKACRCNGTSAIDRHPTRSLLSLASMDGIHQGHNHEASLLWLYVGVNKIIRIRSQANKCGVRQPEYLQFQSKHEHKIRTNQVFINILVTMLEAEQLK